MKRSKLGLLVYLVFVVAMLSSQTSAPAAAPIELSLASMHAPASESVKQLERWIDRIKADTNGQITIRHYPSSTLIAPPDMREGIKAGTADIGNSFVFKTDPDFQVGQYLSVLTRGVDVPSCVKIYDEIWAKYPDLMASQWKNFKLLWTVPSATIVIITVKKPVRTMEDLKGLQIRIATKSDSDMMKSLGATPVSLSMHDFIVSLDKGTTDGAAAHGAAIYDFKFGGKIKYCTVFPLGSPINFLIMNKDSWNKLSPDLQKAIDNTLAWTKQDAIDTWTKVEKNANEYMKASGIEIIRLSPNEYAKWDATIKPVFNSIAKDLDAKGYPGTELVNFCRERSAFYSTK